MQPTPLSIRAPFGSLDSRARRSLSIGPPPPARPAPGRVASLPDRTLVRLAKRSRRRGAGSPPACAGGYLGPESRSGWCRCREPCPSSRRSHSRSLSRAAESGLTRALGSGRSLRQPVQPKRKPVETVHRRILSHHRDAKDFSIPVAPRLLSTDDAPPPPLSRAEAPSADESLPVRSRLRGTAAEPPLVSPALPPRPSFLACLHELARAFSLDPPDLAGCSPESEGRMPSIDFCNRMDPRAHLANLPNPGVSSPRQFAPVRVRIDTAGPRR